MSSFRSLSLVMLFAVSPIASAQAPVVNASTQASTEILSIEERLQRMERRAARISELTLEIHALKQENRELRGAIETQAHQLEQMKRKQRNLYLDVDQRLSNLQSGGSGVVMPSSPAAISSSKPNAVALVVDNKPPAQAATPVSTRQNVALSGSDADVAAVEAEYQAAYKLLTPQERRYKEAVVALKAFIKKYPSSALVGNAQYWLGEAYYVSQDNKNAITAFRKLVADHPDSSKIPGALYKIGRIQYVEGDVAGAKKTLNSVKQQHANSAAAGLAEQMLARIQRETR